MPRLWKPIRPPGVSGATMRVRVSGNGGAASSSTVQCGGCAGRWVATRRRTYAGRPVSRSAGIGPAGLTRDPRARKTDDRQTTVAVGPAGGGGVCVCARTFILYIYTRCP